MYDQITLLYTCNQHLVNQPTVQFSSVAQSCLTLCDPMNCTLIKKKKMWHSEFLEKI